MLKLQKCLELPKFQTQEKVKSKYIQLISNKSILFFATVTTEKVRNPNCWGFCKPCQHKRTKKPPQKALCWSSRGGILKQMEKHSDILLLIL